MSLEIVIGLEVHVQLLTRSKMFCRCSADYASAPPNTHVCPVCLGMPGVLPTINQKAIEYTIMTALALNCTVSEYTKFDRKNYPYPDLMKGYQISQYDAPVGRNGWLTIDVNGETRKAEIIRVHLEEDVAKLLHRAVPNGESCSLVDVNRSGVPLMEVVGAPDLRSPEEARQYLIKLRSILQYLGVSTGNMEEGSFRCDANISLRLGENETTPKVEVKNMNSFKAVYQALEYEAKRQEKALGEGKKLIQETRGWVDETGKTVSQRSKEYAHDYRYFPEPDLPPLVLAQGRVQELRAGLCELPEARRDRFIAEYRLPEYDASLLVASKDMADYFEACLGTEEFKKLSDDKGAKEVSNWLLGETNRIINATGIDIKEFAEKVSPARLCGLVLSTYGTINALTAKDVLQEMFKAGKNADEIIAQRGLAQISDTSALEAEVATVIKNNQAAVADYRAGKTQALKFLVGQVMKATKGRGNPAVVNELLAKKLEEG